MDVTNHISLGLVGDPDGTAVVETTSGIGLDDCLHGGLRVDLIAIVDLLHIEVGLALHCDRDLADKVVERSLVGLRVGGVVALAPDIVLVGLNLGQLLQRTLCHSKQWHQHQNKQTK